MTSIALNSVRPALPRGAATPWGGVRAARYVMIALVLWVAMISGVAHANPDSPIGDKGLSDHTSDYVQDYLSDRRRVGALAGSILGGALTAHPAGTVVGSIIGFLIGKQTMFEDYGAKNQAQSLAASRRDIVPHDGQVQNAQTLSFANAQGLSFDTPPAPEPIAQQASPVQVAPTAPVLSAASTAVAPTPAAGPVLPATPAMAPVRRPVPESAVLARSAPDVPKGEQAPVVSVYAGAPPPVTLAAASPVSVPRGYSRELIAQICSSRSALPTDPRLRVLCFYSQSN